MDIERVDIGEVTVFSFREEDQLREPDALALTISQAIEQDRRFFLIDMGNVSYISSSVLGLFITTMRELKVNNGAIKLLNPQPSVSNVLRMTRLDRVIEMFNDRSAAMKSFS